MRHRKARRVAAGVMLAAMLSSCTAEVAGRALNDPVGDRPAVVAPPHLWAPPTGPSTSAPEENPPEDLPQVYPEPAGPPAIPEPMESVEVNEEFDDDALQVDASDLLETLTDALQAHDRDAFQGHFSGEARRRATFWWDNLDAIGFDGGAVSLVDDGSNLDNMVTLDEDGTGHLWNVAAGAHFPGDGVDPLGRQVVPTALYQWKVAYDRESKALTVTGWTSLEHTPWDCLCTLEVLPAKDGVVVAYPDEVESARPVVSRLDRATAWTRDFLLEVTEPFDPVNDLLSSGGGVVLFVTDDDDRMLDWFSPVRDGGDRGLGGGVVAYVTPGNGYEGRDPDLVSGRPFQGSRMVALLDDVGWLEPTLVHELVHYAFDRQVRTSPLISNHPYVYEGIAEMVAQIFTTDHPGATGPVIGTPEQAWNITPELVRDSFTGDLPTADQLRSDDVEVAAFAYDVAASAYSYLALEYGLPATFEAAECAYRAANLFGCVPDPDGARSRTGELVDTLPVESVTHAWAQWFRKTYG
ncbi:hypothetical protein D1871_18190 [Nakamurella silvestris]|nr:hypothetical protein D1871_18190 [Nakamurella silvestris]